MKFAIFDVDLTLTRKDTSIEFFKFLCKEDKRFLTYVPNSLKSALYYGVGIYDAKRSKEDYFSFLGGLREGVVDKLSYKFFRTYVVGKLLYDDALNEIKKRKSQGYEIILISASPEFYLKYFKEFSYIDYVIGTRYEVFSGYYTGRMIGNNNRGAEKIARLYEYLYDKGLEEVDFEDSFMYSDSMHDLPLFNLAKEGFLINSNKEIEGLKNVYWN